MVKGSEFHFIGIFHIDGMNVPVQIDNDGNGYGGFRGSNGNNEQSKENPLQLVRVQIFIKGNEINIHAVQDELHRHQHRDEVPPGKKTISPDKKKGSADKQDMR